jgi:1-acyl-sn-glycerol-3-phosphate acyltransferase
MGYSLLKFLISPLVKLIWIKRVNGLENIPRKGPIIIAANHSSYFDFICFIAVCPRKIYYLAAEKFYKSRFWRPLVRLTGQIKVERQTGDKTEAIEKANSILERGDILGIYPEGTRSADGEIHKPFIGVARFALKNKVSVVPVGIKGTFEVLPRQKSLPKFKKIVEINIGKSMDFSQYFGQEENKEVLNKITNEIMAEIADLSGKKAMKL